MKKKLLCLFELTQVQVEFLTVSIILYSHCKIKNTTAFKNIDNSLSHLIKNKSSLLFVQFMSARMEHQLEVLAARFQYRLVRPNLFKTRNRPNNVCKIILKHHFKMCDRRTNWVAQSIFEYLHRFY